MGQEGASSRCQLTAAACSAALSSCLAVTFCAPALSQPLGSAVLLLVVAPMAAAAVAALVVSLVGRLTGAPRGLAAALGALLGALPWLLVASSPLARLPWMAAVGFGVVAVVGGLVLGRVRPRLALVAPLAGIVALVFAPAGKPFDLPTDPVRPVVIYGVDSATWDQVDPLIAAGELPNWKRLKEISATGVLMSEEPTFSASLWTILATGTKPADNGVLDFENTRYDLVKGRFWDQAQREGAKIGICSWLITWPPDGYSGFQVPGWLAQGPEAVPPSAGFGWTLQNTVRGGGSLFSGKAIGAGITAMSVSRADHALWNLGVFAKKVTTNMSEPDSFWRLNLVDANFASDLYFELMAREQPGLSAYIHYPVDKFGHHYWAYHEPEKFEDVTPEQVERFGEVVRDAYRQSDEILGRLLDRIDLETTTLVLISDHGMKARDFSRRTARLRAGNLLKALGVQDGEMTFAVAGELFVLTAVDKGPSGEALLTRVHGALAASHMEHDANLSPFLMQELDVSSYQVAIGYEPRALAHEESAIVLNGSPVPTEELFREEERSGTHTLLGVVAMAGPGIEAGGTIPEADVYDITPTVLHAMGLAVPEDLPGSVLSAAYTAEFLSRHPVETRPGHLPPPPNLEFIEGDEGSAGAALSEMGYTEDEEEEPFEDDELDPTPQ